MLKPASSCGIAVIGCGQWGRNHLRCFHAIPHCRVTAVDTDRSKLSTLRQSIAEVEFADDYRKVLNDPRVNAVVISTPAATHFRMVHAALLAGKHVLCEKPLCRTSLESLQLFDLADKAGLVLAVGHTFLFNSGIEQLKKLVDEEVFGELRSLSAVRANLGPVRRDVNAVFDLATHDIAIFNWLLNAEPEFVSAIGGDYLQEGIEDVVFVHLKYPQRRVASIHASWLNPIKVRQMTVIGSRRMATLDDLVSPPLVIHERHVAEASPFSQHDASFSIREGRAWQPDVSGTEPLFNQAQHFVEVIQGRAELRGNADFSIGVMRTLEGITQSLRLHGGPVSVRSRDAIYEHVSHI